MDRQEHTAGDETCPEAGKESQMNARSVREGKGEKHLCIICGKTFATKNGLQRHSRLHTGEIPYQCDICDMRFRFSCSVYRHVRKYHKGVPLSEAVIKPLSATDITDGSLLDANAKTDASKCSDKEGMARTEDELSRNCKSLHCDSNQDGDKVGAIRRVQCAICDKTVSNKYKLQEHMLVHTKEKRFECKCCQKKYRYYSNLHRHSRVVHNQAPPPRSSAKSKRQSGQQIGKKDSTSKPRPSDTTTTSFLMDGSGGHDDLVELIHTTENVGDGNNQRHDDGRSVGPENRETVNTFKCVVCCETLVHKSSLRDHMLIHTGQKPFKCEFCEKTFRHSSNLYRHVRKRHKGCSVRKAVRMPLDQQSCNKEITYPDNEADAQNELSGNSLTFKIGCSKDNTGESSRGNVNADNEDEERLPSLECVEDIGQAPTSHEGREPPVRRVMDCQEASLSSGTKNQGVTVGNRIVMMHGGDTAALNLKCHLCGMSFKNHTLRQKHYKLLHPGRVVPAQDNSSCLEENGYADVAHPSDAHPSDKAGTFIGNFRLRDSKQSGIVGRLRSKSLLKKTTGSFHPVQNSLLKHLKKRLTGRAIPEHYKELRPSPDLAMVKGEGNTRMVMCEESTMVDLEETSHTGDGDDLVRADLSNTSMASSTRGNQVMHQCTRCGKKCKTNAHLNEHMRSHTKEMPFECDFCERKFRYISGILRHKKKFHKGFAVSESKSVLSEMKTSVDAHYNVNDSSQKESIGQSEGAVVVSAHVQANGLGLSKQSVNQHEEGGPSESGWGKKYGYWSRLDVEYLEQEVDDDGCKSGGVTMEKDEVFTNNEPDGIHKRCSPHNVRSAQASMSSHQIQAGKTRDVKPLKVKKEKISPQFPKNTQIEHYWPEHGGTCSTYTRLGVHLRSHTKKMTFRCSVCLPKHFQGQKLHDSHVKKCNKQRTEPKCDSRICKRLKVKEEKDGHEHVFKWEPCDMSCGCSTLLNDRNVRVAHKTISVGDNVAHNTISIGDNVAHNTISIGDNVAHNTISIGDNVAYNTISIGDNVAHNEISVGDSANVMEYFGDKRVKSFEDIVSKNEAVITRVAEKTPKGDNLAKLKCVECGKICSTIAILMEHTRSHTGEKPLKCYFCDTRFRYTSARLLHMKTFHKESFIRVPGNKPFKCPSCDYKFKFLRYLHQHMEDSHTTCPIEKDVQDFGVGHSGDDGKSKRENKKWEYSSVTVPTNLKCTFCGKGFSSSQDCLAHMEGCCTGDRPFECDICGQTFKYRTNRAKHVRLIHRGSFCPPVAMTQREDGSVECAQCAEKFSSIDHFKEHAKRHRHKQPIKCEFCEMRFSYVSTLNHHVKNAHKGFALKQALSKDSIGEYRQAVSARTEAVIAQVMKGRQEGSPLKFKCVECYRSYASSFALREHVRYHTGELPLKCYYCHERFKKATVRLRHMKEVHCQGTRPKRPKKGKPVLLCVVCGKTFSSKYQLTVHMRTHTGEQPFQCDSCHLKFKHNGSFQRHLNLRNLRGECPDRKLFYLRKATGNKPVKWNSSGHGVGNSHRGHRSANYGALTNQVGESLPYNIDDLDSVGNPANTRSNTLADDSSVSVSGDQVGESLPYNIDDLDSVGNPANTRSNTLADDSSVSVVGDQVGESLPYNIDDLDSVGNPANTGSHTLADDSSVSVSGDQVGESLPYNIADLDSVGNPANTRSNTLADDSSVSLVGDQVGESLPYKIGDLDSVGNPANTRSNTLADDSSVSVTCSSMAVVAISTICNASNFMAQSANASSSSSSSSACNSVNHETNTAISRMNTSLSLNYTNAMLENDLVSYNTDVHDRVPYFTNHSSFNEPTDSVGLSIIVNANASSSNGSDTATLAFSNAVNYNPSVTVDTTGTFSSLHNHLVNLEGHPIIDNAESCRTTALTDMSANYETNTCSIVDSSMTMTNTSSTTKADDFDSKHYSVVAILEPKDFHDTEESTFLTDGEFQTDAKSQPISLDVTVPSSSVHQAITKTCPENSQSQVDDDGGHRKGKHVKRYQCSSCSKMVCNIQEHMRRHTGEKPYKCNYCDLSFKYSSGLLRHSKKFHADSFQGRPKPAGPIKVAGKFVKRFECSWCGKLFAQKHHLEEHVKRHTGVKPFECRYCEMSFRHLNTVLRHERKVHRRCPLKKAVLQALELGQICDKYKRRRAEMSILGEMEEVESYNAYKTKDKSESEDDNIIQAKANNNNNDNNNKTSPCANLRHMRGCPCRHVADALVENYQDIQARAESVVADVIKSRQKGDGSEVMSDKLRCVECGKKCLSIFDLREHTRFHTGQRPLKCFFCDQRFRYTNSRLRHMKDFHQDQPIPKTQKVHNRSQPYGTD